MYLYGFLTVIIVVQCLLLSSVKSDENLQCYVCNSNEHRDCGDANALGSYIQDCTVPNAYCRKAVQTVQKEVSIVRSCGSNVGNRACYKTAGKNSASVCSCNTQLCNHAGIDIKQNRILTFVISIIFILVSMLLLR